MNEDVDILRSETCQKIYKSAALVGVVWIFGINFFDDSDICWEFLKFCFYINLNRCQFFYFFIYVFFWIYIKCWGLTRLHLKIKLFFFVLNRTRKKWIMDEAGSDKRFFIWTGMELVRISDENRMQFDKSWEKLRKSFWNET